MGSNTYRQNAITGSILSVEPEKKPEAKADPEASIQTAAVKPMPRDEVLDGKTYKVKWPNSPHAYYVVINDTTEEDGTRRPFELFINTQNVDDQEWISALTRMISAVFRRGGDVEFVASELMQIFAPRGGAYYKGSYTTSLVAAIGGVLRQHMVSIGYVLDPKEVVSAAQIEAPVQAAPIGKACVDCGEHAVKVEGGCSVCKACGYSESRTALPCPGFAEELVRDLRSGRSQAVCVSPASAGPDLVFRTRKIRIPDKKTCPVFVERFVRDSTQIIALNRIFKMDHRHARMISKLRSESAVSFSGQGNSKSRTALACLGFTVELVRDLGSGRSRESACHLCASPFRQACHRFPDR